MDYFEILGVERRFHLGADELERRFHERSRQLHPDRHVKADPQTRVRSALAASELNQAYRALRDPVRRAEYLLGLSGIKLTDERDGHKVAPAFLMEMLELREALGEAQEAGDHARVSALAAEVRQRRNEATAAMDAGFTRYEAGGGEAALREVADAMIGERYFRRFLDDVEKFEDQRAEAADGAGAGDKS